MSDEQVLDDDEAVTVAESLEEASGALEEGSVTLPAELAEGIKRYTRHVIHVLNSSEAEEDMEELLLQTVTNIGLACFVLGATANSDAEEEESEPVVAVVPASVVVAALRGGYIPLRLVIE